MKTCEGGNHTPECQRLAATEKEWGGCLSKRSVPNSVVFGGDSKICKHAMLPDICPICEEAKPLRAELATLRAMLTEKEQDAINWAKMAGASQAQLEKVVDEYEDKLTQTRADLAEMTERARKYRVALFKTGCNAIFCSEFEKDCEKCQEAAREAIKE